MLEERRLAVLQKAWEAALVAFSEPHDIALEKIVEIYLRMGRLEDALKVVWEDRWCPNTSVLANLMIWAPRDLGRLDDALRLAEMVAENVGEDLLRAEILSRLAEALLNGGRFEEAMEVIVKLVEVIKGMMIGPLEWRIMSTICDEPGYMLTRVASALIRAGRIREVLWIVQNVSGVEGCESALKSIALDLASSGFPDEALEVAGYLESWKNRVSVLNSVIDAFVNASKLDKAWEVAGELAREALQAAMRGVDWLSGPYYLGLAVDALIKSGRLEEALNVAWNAANEEVRCGLLLRAASALAKHGEAERALSVLEEVVRMIAGARNETLRRVELGVVVEAFTRLGRLDRALQVIRETKDERTRISLTLVVARALAETGRIDDAMRILGEVQSIPGESSSDARKLVKAFAEAGMYEKVLQLVTRFENEHDRLPALLNMVDILVRSGGVEEALKIAESLGGVRERSEVLASIALALAKEGRIKEALEMAIKVEDAKVRTTAIINFHWFPVAMLEITENLEKVLIAANNIEDEDDRSYFLEWVSEGLMKAGRFEEALRVARKIGNTKQRSMKLAEFAEALANAGRLEEALEVARSIEDAYWRSSALHSVASILAEAGRLEEALEVARSIEKMLFRSWAMVRVANALAEAGRLEESLKLKEEALEIARGAAGSEDLGWVVIEALMNF